MSYAVERANNYNEITVKIGNVERTFRFYSGGNIDIPQQTMTLPSGVVQVNPREETVCTGIVEVSYSVGTQIKNWFKDNYIGKNLGTAIHRSITAQNDENRTNILGKFENYFNICSVKSVGKLTISDLSTPAQLEISFSLNGWEDQVSEPLSN